MGEGGIVGEEGAGRGARSYEKAQLNFETAQMMLS